MRVLILLVLFLYTGVSQSSVDEFSLQDKTQRLLKSLLEIEYPTAWSAVSQIELRHFLGFVPRVLLSTPDPDEADDIENYSIEHREVSMQSEENPSDSAIIKRQVLHFLLHQYDDKHGISRSRQWRHFSGWERNWFGLAISANNQDARAYAQESGLRSSAEDFVTTAEYFIFPPTTSIENSIKCRMSLKYDFVKSLFKTFYSPLDSDDIQCRNKASGMLDDVIFTDPNNGKPINLGPINEDTVLGFELLYATPGTGDASEVAGHLLLRIKLDNNPQAKELGIENPNDLIISFLANTQPSRDRFKAPAQRVQKECSKNWLDSSEQNQGEFAALQTIIQSLKGLTGGFLTMMDRQTLAEAIKNYTIEEDRDLLRYELKFSSAQTRNLLEQLYRAKKNYNASYYFFHQNCASVLVKVIGMGIQSEKIAQFSPAVSPPNSLVALFIREGLLQPVRPAFFSYRKKAYMAQDVIKNQYRHLRQGYPQLHWPDINALFSPDQENRLRLLRYIGRYVGFAADLDRQFYRLFILIQEAEMAFEHKDLICEQYTSVVTAQARRFQQTLLQKTSFTLSGAIKHDTIHQDTMAQQYVDSETESYQQGVPHTKLLAYQIAAGQYRSYSRDTSVLAINATLDEQEFGSISSVAMQRSSYVKLASANVVLSQLTERADKLHSWHFTGFDIRKFKDRLNRVPGYFDSAGSMGLGLSLLDFEKDYVLDIQHGSWLGGELLFNLVSSAGNNDFLYLSIGADYRRHKQASETRNGLVIPARLETLWSFDNKRRWQWRNKLEYRHGLDNDFEYEVDISTVLTYQIGEVAGRLLLLRMSSDYKKYGSGEVSQLSWIGVEFNPF